MNSSTHSTPQSLFIKPRLAIFAMAVAMAVCSAKLLPETNWSTWLAVAAILIAVWHGAFDGVLAEEALAPRLGRHWRNLFYPAYLALGAGVLLLWWRVPVVALCAFLLYSALHFGTESERRFSAGSLVTGIAAGLVPIAASSRWCPQQVVSIFTVMLRGDVSAARLLTSSAGTDLWPIVAVSALGGLRTSTCTRSTWYALLLTELVLFYTCTPIVAFALFFCLWHTPEHLLSTSTNVHGNFDPERLVRNLRGGFAFWLVSMLGISIVYLLGIHQLSHCLGVLLIALSALTVPHMALGELTRRQQIAASMLPFESPSSRQGAIE